MSTTNDPAPSANQATKPSSQSAPDELADALAAEWQSLTDAAGKLTEAIMSLGEESPDLDAAKKHVTDGIAALAHAPSQLSLIYLKLKQCPTPQN